MSWTHHLNSRNSRVARLRYQWRKRTRAAARLSGAPAATVPNPDANPASDPRRLPVHQTKSNHIKP